MRLKKGQTLKGLGVPEDRVDPIDCMVRGNRGRVVQVAKQKNKQGDKKKTYLALGRTHVGDRQAKPDVVLEKLNLELQEEINRLNRQLKSISVDFNNYSQVQATLNQIILLLNNALVDTHRNGIPLSAEFRVDILIKTVDTLNTSIGSADVREVAYRLEITQLRKDLETEKRRGFKGWLSKRLGLV